jgi:endonuclease YncB( thermonuclease family)
LAVRTHLISTCTRRTLADIYWEDENAAKQAYRQFWQEDGRPFAARIHQARGRRRERGSAYRKPAI